MTVTIRYRNHPPLGTLGANAPAWLLNLRTYQRDELERIHRALLLERLHVLRKRTPRNQWIRRAIACLEASRG